MLGLLSWSLPVFLLHGLKAKLTLASGALSFIPDCCTPQPSPHIFTGPVESPVRPCPVPGHSPLGQLGVQLPAPSIFSPLSTELAASLGSPMPMCHIYRLLGQGVEPWGIPAGSRSMGRQDFAVACRPFACCWYLQLPNGWQVLSPKLPSESKGGHPAGPRAAGCNDEDQMCICCPQAALVTRTACPHHPARQAPAKEGDTGLGTWGQQSYGSPLPVISHLPT